MKLRLRSDIQMHGLKANQYDIWREDNDVHHNCANEYTVG